MYFCLHTIARSVVLLHKQVKVISLAGQNCIPRAQIQGRTEVICPISTVNDALVGSSKPQSLQLVALQLHDFVILGPSKSTPVMEIEIMREGTASFCQLKMSEKQTCKGKASKADLSLSLHQEI